MGISVTNCADKIYILEELAINQGLYNQLLAMYVLHFLVISSIAYNTLYEVDIALAAIFNQVCTDLKLACTWFLCLGSWFVCV